MLLLAPQSVQSFVSVAVFSTFTSISSSLTLLVCDINLQYINAFYQPFLFLWRTGICSHLYVWSSAVYISVPFFSMQRKYPGWVQVLCLNAAKVSGLSSSFMPQCSERIRVEFKFYASMQRKYPGWVQFFCLNAAKVSGLSSSFMPQCSESIRVEFKFYASMQRKSPGWVLVLCLNAANVSGLSSSFMPQCSESIRVEFKF